MRILFLIDNLGGGGAQRLIADLVCNICGDMECELLLLNNINDKYYTKLKKLGINIYVVPEKYTSPLLMMHYMWRIIRAGNYSVIHANLFPAFYYLALIKKMHKNCPPILMTEHSTDNARRKKRYLRIVEKFIYSTYDHIISISAPTQDNLLLWLHSRDSDRFSVISNGVDIHMFALALPYKKRELFPNIQENDILVATVGSFTPQKNHRMLLEALRLLPERYRLVLAGDGPLRKKIEEMVKSYQLSGRIQFLGFRSDVERIMKTADVVCVPSVWEGFGLVAVEAMATQVPLAVSDIAGLSEIAADCAVKFDPYNPQSIADGILSAYGNQSAKTKEAEKQRAECFDIRSTSDAYIDLFRRVDRKDGQIN